MGDWVKISLELNGKCIAARQFLLYSLNHNIHELRVYAIPRNGNGVEAWKPEEWEKIFEMEAVLNYIKLLTTKM